MRMALAMLPSRGESAGGGLQFQDAPTLESQKNLFALQKGIEAARHRFSGRGPHEAAHAEECECLRQPRQDGEAYRQAAVISLPANLLLSRLCALLVSGTVIGN